MSKLVLSDVTNINSITTINANFEKIQEELQEKVLYRNNPDGEPNHMLDNLDMNGNKIINAGEVRVGSLVINGVPVEPTTGVTTASAFQVYEYTATEGQTTFSVAPHTPFVSSLQVEVNGLSYPPSGYDVSGTDVIIPSASAGDEVVIRRFVNAPTTIPTAEDITFIQNGAGAVSRTMREKAGETVSVKDFGAVGDGVADDTAAIQAAINEAAGAAGTGRATVWLPEGRYAVTGVAMASRVILAGPGELYPVGDGVAALTLLDVLYSSVRDISIYLNAANQKAIRIASSSSYSQLNTFYGVKIDGPIPAGSVGIELDNTFSNTFYGVNILRAATGVTFANGANANHFYGGEIRGNNVSANCNNPVVHGAACWSNGFHGTVLENWRLPIQMNGGVLTIDSGCYIEAYASSQSIQMSGGDLRVIGNYLNNGFIFISGGNSISVNDNTFDGLLSNSGYPFIKYTADVATRLNCKGNQVLDTSTPGVLLQPRQYWTGSAFTYRSIGNRVEFVDNKPVRFQARMIADALNVTGDGTTYTVAFGNNEQFDDNSNFSTGTSTFTAPENGIYSFEASLFFSGLTIADHNNLQVKIVTSNRAYNLYLSNVDGVVSTSGEFIIRGTALADMEAGDTATVTAFVSGTNKTVDILRGDATNGYSTFSGFKVA